MKLVNGITEAPLQNKTLILPDGSNLVIQLYYRPNQLGWFFNSIVNLGFQVNGLRITSSPNMLRPWKDKISFGLGCFTVDNREPTQIQDFSTGASKLYVLTASEVVDYERILAAR